MPRIASSITPPDRSLPAYFVHQSLCNGSGSASTHGKRHPIPRLSANVDRSRIKGIPRDVSLFRPNLSPPRRTRALQPQKHSQPGWSLALHLAAVRNGTRVCFCSPLQLSCDPCLQKVTSNQASPGSPATPVVSTRLPPRVGSFRPVRNGS